jgi:hypothetical protein
LDTSYLINLPVQDLGRTTKKTIFDYRSPAADAYLTVIEEVLKRVH